MAPKRRWNLAIDGKNILHLIKKKRIIPDTLDQGYILKVKRDNPAEFGEFTNDRQFVTNYKKAIAKIRAGEDLEGGRKKSKCINLPL